MTLLVIHSQGDTGPKGLPGEIGDPGTNVCIPNNSWSDFLSRGHPTGICELLWWLRCAKVSLRIDVFRSTHGNRKLSFFSFYMPWRYQICMAKSHYSYRDDLPKISSRVQKFHFRLTFVAQKRRCLNSLTFFGSSAPTRTRCPIWKQHVVGVVEVQSNDRLSFTTVTQVRCESINTRC